MVDKLTLERLEDRLLLDGANGVLQVDNFVGTHTLNNSFEGKHFSAGTEGYGPGDISVALGFDASGAYTTVEGNDLRIDARPPTSTTPFNIQLFYKGNLAESTENYLEVSMPWVDIGWDFGTDPITIQTESGQRYDVREAITEGAGTGIIPLADVPAGTYSASEPYATAQVHFNKTADLNNDGTIDAVDLALMNNNWLNEEGVTPSSPGYLFGDLNGDGIVNLQDFSKLSEQYSTE